MTTDTYERRVLVTGGAGFIGAHLCRRLLQQNAHVVCLDNMWSGRKENLADICDHPAFTLIEGDVRDAELYESLGAFDEIYNLACPASPPFYQKDPLFTIETCFFGARNALELARRTGARILQTSTSEVYGEPLEHPQSESYRGNVNPIGIRACYDEGKRASEAMFFDYQRKYGVDIRVVRIFNTYGPGMRADDGRVVSNFINQALAGEDITLYGDGLQTRSFCYVDDLVAGLMAMMACEGFSGPVNLGNPGEFTMVELAETIQRFVDKPLSLVYRERPADDPTRRCPDISLAHEKLGWSPTTPLAEGLAKTIAHFASVRS